MSMDSRDFGEEIPLQTPLSSGSSSSSLLSSSSSSADSHVAAVSSINENKLKVSKFETNNGIGEGGSSDVGSENEGFLSGEEEFESAVDRPIVGYPDEDTLQGGDSGASFVGFEKGSSTPVSIRPIAKVSVDSDDDDDGDDDDGEEEVLGSSRVDVLEDGSVGKEGVGNEVAFPKIEGNEVDILEDKEEKEDKETFVSGEDENLGGDSDREEGTVELSGNSNEGKVPESSPVEDVGFVSEESPNAGKQVSDGVQLNDVVINQQLNEVLGGEQEAKLNEGSLNAGKESDGVQLNDVIEKKQPNDVLSGGEEAEVDKGSLNASKKVSDEIQLNDVIEKQQSNEVSNEGQEVKINEGNLVAEKRADGGIELNDREAAKDEEQLKESETGVSVDDKAHEGDPASPKVLEVAGEFTSEDLDEKTLLVNSLGSGTTGVANREETKDLENGVTADSVNGTGAKVDNGFDNVRHEADKSVEHNYVVSNSGIDGNKLVINNEVATEEGFEGERAVITGIAEDEKFAATNAEDQQHDGLVPLAVNEETMSLLDPPDEAGIDNDSKDDSKSREITTGEVEAESSKEATSLVKETVPDNASVKDIRISDTPEIAEPIDNEEDGEEHHLVEEGDVEGSVTDGETEDVIFGSSEAAKQFLEELERGSGAGSHSGAESSHGLSQRIDGQIVTDSDDVDTDDEGDGKELFDSAALAALLKAARDTGSDGGPITVTSQDGSRLFSIERPAGLGSSLASVRNASRPSRLPSFTPSNPRIEDDSENKLSEEEKTKLQKLQQIRVNFLRLVQRLGVSLEDSLVAQVLYRFGLVAGRSSGQLFSFDNAKNTAIQLEAEGKEDFNFSLNILVLGKTGVGKSATINSIFGEEKTPINAFGPGTTTMKEIVGVVDGVKYRIFDSPGLKSSSSDRSINHKILSSIKNVMKKFPPDIVLYVDRLDNQTRDLNDLLLLRSISSSLDSSIWKNAIITLTHGACGPPDGPSGFPLGYEVFVAQRSHVLQQTVAQAVGDLRILNPTLMNPVSLVENNPSCRKNKDGQKVLPNGQNWRSQLLLLCYSIKILAEVGNLSKAPDSFDHRKLFGLRARSPPLPFLLSGLLQSRAHPKLSSDQGGENGDSDIDLGDLSDSDQEEEEDEYDQLPPFKPLRRSQIAKLSKEQRKAYFEEYDYRVKLLQKKQWKEELRRMREIKKKGQPSLDDFGYIGEDDQENGSPAAVQVPLPDMALPPSFDGDNPAFRYRFLEPTSQFLARPVLDTHGWDHDCGYDGVNLEHSLAIVNRFPAAVAVQITKDKKEFNIHLDSSVSAKHGENGSTMAGFDIQNIGRQLAYILRGETKFKNFRKNRTAAGISVTFLGENVCTGLKVEDQITIGKRVVLVGSTGTVRSQGDSAFGANLEMRLRESDFPIGQDQSSLGLSLVKWRGDMALGANFQSQFSLGRSYKMAVRAGLNNKLSGQISVRTSSSDQLQIALLAILPVARSIYNILRPGVAENYSAY